MTVPYASQDATDDEGKCYDNDNDDDKHRIIPKADASSESSDILLKRNRSRVYDHLFVNQVFSGPSPKI